MQFGYFDDDRKEYVITRPDTPRSWSNYLGTTEYGAIITNNAGGYSFYKSAAQGRFTRLRFNAVPLDQPGRYIYIHDRDNHDYWSASWQPVGKALEQYKSECRHGTAYTVIRSEYDSIESETRYFVPLGKNYECWLVKLTNKDQKKRRLRLFTYVEYACNWNALDDMLNLQYVMYIANMKVVDGIIDHGTNIFIPSMPDNFQEKDQGRHTFLAAVGAEVTGYDTDRDVFIGGPYRTYANPAVVEAGECRGSLAAGDNPCGTLQIDVDLAPGESKELLILMGIGEAATAGKAAMVEFNDIRKAHTALDEVRQFWHRQLTGMTVHTPDPEFNSMMNMWSPYNCLITFTWSRAASLIYAGERDGLGYRDTVQDFMGVMHNITDQARERLELMITGQVSTGGAMPVVKQFAHHPGRETPPDEKAYRSDDCLWLFPSIDVYVKESGNLAFYEKVLPYADVGEDTVLGHLRRAIEFNLERSGAHGLPCGLSADWNDCLELGHEGESVFVAFQLRWALQNYIDVCQRLNKPDEIAWAQPLLETLDDNLDKHCWDGEWYLRAFRYDGLKFGSHKSKEGSIFLNAQSWAVLSGHASEEKARSAMNAVAGRLATEYGVAICDPPFEKTDFTVIRATLMNKGMKENGGIFSHTQGWAIMAETMLGHGNQAYRYMRAFMPAAYNTRAEIREIEPYVNCQSTHSKYSPRYGASRIPWLSGSATWSYYAATQYILGIRPTYNGLEIDPCVPSDWQEFSVQRQFRGKMLSIRVINPHNSEKGVRRLVLNGTELDGNVIPVDALEEKNDVLVEME